MNQYDFDKRSKERLEREKRTPVHEKYYIISYELNVLKAEFRLEEEKLKLKNFLDNQVWYIDYEELCLKYEPKIALLENRMDEYKPSEGY